MTEALWFDELDSTNAEGRRRAEAGETGPLWIAARRQTAGRGRRGRSWSSEEGNLAATLLTTTDKPPAEAAQLSFVAALAVADLARAYVPDDLVRLKWPNDPLIDGRKVSGVLIESGTREDGRLWLACGVGVNLTSAPAETERAATSLAQHLSDGVAAPSPEEALTALALAFNRWFGRWSAEGFGPIRAAWTEQAAGLGGQCVARLGTETVSGVAEALDADGALVLRLPTGRARRISAGDVFFGVKDGASSSS